jgi:hypothetical protein
VLAVVHDVDAELDLLAHHVGHGLSHARGERVTIVGEAGVLGMERGQELARAREASAMGGEDAIGASVHKLLPFDPSGFAPR